ncbi:hypothetical protein SY27_14460 [Flavobacterium sp. 316]|uniref:hypothetical protein n=1 Tax=Flavobacterium sp. 316 TaxID=1603293 RepID=UPI0005E53246|nr:hypothetical protein [Flavobacterium sp. 316]KIX20320.1 hypothetical protein SY27_14460 [Flavobacterium sp. 316]
MKFYIFILHICTLIFCLLGFSQENKINEKEIVIQQLKAGKYTGGDEFESYKFSEKDVYATFNIITKELENNGYKTITNTEFNEKIKKIFGRIIDNNTQTKFLSVDFFDKCNRNPIYSRLEIFNNIFIIKEKCFITKLYAIPELIDYQKKYPDLKKIEDEIIYRNEPDLGNQIIIPHWKDISDLDQQRKKNIQTLVARNMYLFNDSKAHFKWLILNDAYFLESLVTKFGYYDDVKLLNWVIEGNVKFDDDNPEALDQLFWNKKCDGTVKLNLEIFPVLKEIITPKDVNYLEALKMYVMYLLDEEKRNELSLKDRAKLLAHLVYFGEQYRYDSNFNDKSYFMQRIELYDIKGDIKKEIIKNNYYNLPNYQNLYKKSEEYQDALVDENGG